MLVRQQDEEKKILLLSGKTQKDIIILLEALYNRTLSFLFQKVSPINQKELVPVALFVALGQGCFVSIQHKKQPTK